MAAKSVGEAVTQELAGKAVICGPAIAGGLFLGPVGAVLGVLTSVAIVVFGPVAVVLGLLTSVAIVASGSDN
jgi:hypothetical protein